MAAQWIRKAVSKGASSCPRTPKENSNPVEISIDNHFSKRLESTRSLYIRLLHPLALVPVLSSRSPLRTLPSSFSSSLRLVQSSAFIHFIHTKFCRA